MVTDLFISYEELERRALLRMTGFRSDASVLLENQVRGKEVITWEYRLPAVWFLRLGRKVTGYITTPRMATRSEARAELKRVLGLSSVPTGTELHPNRLSLAMCSYGLKLKDHTVHGDIAIQGSNTRCSLTDLSQPSDSYISPISRWRVDPSFSGAEPTSWPTSIRYNLGETRRIKSEPRG